jgi:hypothetical protein
MRTSSNDVSCHEGGGGGCGSEEHNEQRDFASEPWWYGNLNPCVAPLRGKNWEGGKEGESRPSALIPLCHNYDGELVMD